VTDNSEITAPVAKAAAALGAGAGASVVSVTQNAQSFMPTSLSDWMAVVASTVAVVYTLHLMGEWYWKKFWRPWLERNGYKKPTNRKRRYTDAARDELES
jgi:hypothetical protein